MVGILFCSGVGHNCARNRRWKILHTQCCAVVPPCAFLCIWREVVAAQQVLGARGKRRAPSFSDRLSQLPLPGWGRCLSLACMSTLCVYKAIIGLVAFYLRKCIGRRRDLTSKSQLHTEFCGTLNLKLCPVPYPQRRFFFKPSSCRSLISTKLAQRLTEPRR